MMPDLHAWTVVAICNFTVVLSLDIIYHGLVKAFSLRVMILPRVRGFM